MPHNIRFLAVAAVLGVCSPAHANLITETSVFATSLTIPDSDPNGVASTGVFDTSQFSSISSVQVSLNIVGGFNGDFFAYLRHGATGFAVLLNRPGVMAANVYGYADSGINATFSDTAPNGDIHTYQNVANPNGGALTGTWQPDGRTADPGVVTDTSARTAFLSSFDGLDPNGAWTLFVSDNSPVGIGNLEGWSLTISGQSIAATTADGGSTLWLLGSTWLTLVLGASTWRIRFTQRLGAQTARKAKWHDGENPASRGRT
jgi:subtilisin-like proprotein convertase family protein